LDAILLNFNPVFDWANELFENSSSSKEDFRIVHHKATQLEHEFGTWITNLADDWRPQAVGTITQDQLGWSGSDGRSGQVDSYFDRKLSTKKY
jgi:hypothetical protein